MTTDTRTLSRTQRAPRYAGIERVQFPENPAATRAFERIDETLRRFFGARSPFLERAVTWDELVGSGIVEVNFPTVGGQTPGDPVVTPPTTGSDEDPSIPPAPTGLSANAAFVTVILDWDPPAFAYYGHTEIWRASEDNLALAVNVGETQSAIYADAVGQGGVTYYYWIRFVSKAGNPGAFNAVSGTPATTEPGVSYLLDVLTGQLTASQLHASLGDRIDLIDADALTAGSVNARIASAVTTLEAADEVLSQQLLLISAGIGEQFDTAKIWYFDTSVEGWGGNGTPTATGGWLSPANHGSDAYVESPTGNAVDGAAYPQVKMRIRKVGSPTWEGYVWWRAPAGSWDSGNRESFAEPTFDGDGIATVTVTVPWSGTIDSIRLDLSTASSGTDKYEIDWVAIGRASPGASVAALQQEVTARANADSALTTALSTAVARLNSGGDVYTAIVQAQNTANAKNATFVQGTAPTATKVDDLWIHTGDSNRIYRWNGTAWVLADDQRIGSIASSVTTLQSTVGGLGDDVSDLQGSVISLQTASSTYAGQLGDLEAQYTVKIDANGYVSGFGLAVEDPVDATPSSTFAIRADAFYIANPAGPGIPPSMPFTVLATEQTINGVTFAPGVYMTEAYAKKAVVEMFTAGLAVIDDASIASVKAGKILADALDVGQYIESQNYVAGASGWRIGANGVSEFSAIIARGTVYASAGQIGGTVIGANFLQSAGYVAGSAGYRFNADGSAELNNVTVRGTVFASAGVFAGTLSAANGSFSGAVYGGSYSASYAWPSPNAGGFHLSAAGLLVGTYNGTSGDYAYIAANGAAGFSNIYARGNIEATSLKVDAANIVNTLHLQGEAVTIPRGQAALTDVYGVGANITVDNAIAGKRIILMAWAAGGSIYGGGCKLQRWNGSAWETLAEELPRLNYVSEASHGWYDGGTVVHVYTPSADGNQQFRVMGGGSGGGYSSGVMTSIAAIQGKR